MNFRINASLPLAFSFAFLALAQGCGGASEGSHFDSARVDAARESAQERIVAAHCIDGNLCFAQVVDKGRSTYVAPASNQAEILLNPALSQVGLTFTIVGDEAFRSLVNKPGIEIEYSSAALEAQNVLKADCSHDAFTDGPNSGRCAAAVMGGLLTGAVAGAAVATKIPNPAAMAIVVTAGAIGGALVQAGNSCFQLTGSDCSGGRGGSGSPGGGSSSGGGGRSTAGPKGSI
jgi:uncharacterized membrane protein YgcG